MKRRTFDLIGATALAFVLMRDSNGFEIDTHANLTQEAFKRSLSLNDEQQLISLCLCFSRSRVPQTERTPFEIPLGKSYFDFSTTPPTQRNAHKYDY
jgi:hypothetical protein